jgi:hypothetical protein
MGERTSGEKKKMKRKKSSIITAEKETIFIFFLH